MAFLFYVYTLAISNAVARRGTLGIASASSALSGRELEVKGVTIRASVTKISGLNFAIGFALNFMIWR
jgi:hypothetical protein